ncbi:MAG: hypothetical protein ACW99G_20135 [Candidatus Thorarchaeota archaeon]
MMSKKPMPTEEEVRDYFQRAYYLVPIHSEGETVYQYDWIGPALPVLEESDD